MDLDNELLGQAVLPAVAVLHHSRTNMVRKAILRLTADNAYRVYLDGREIGQGGNWNSLTDYDVTWLLAAGAHVLAVEALMMLGREA